MGAGVAADSREAVLQETTGEELVDDLGDHPAPFARGRGEALVPHQAELPEVALQEPVERRGPGPAGVVDPHPLRRGLPQLGGDRYRHGPTWVLGPASWGGTPARWGSEERAEHHFSAGLGNDYGSYT